MKESYSIAAVDRIPNGLYVVKSWDASGQTHNQLGLEEGDHVSLEERDWHARIEDGQLVMLNRDERTGEYHLFSCDAEWIRAYLAVGGIGIGLNPDGAPSVLLRYNAPFARDSRSADEDAPPRFSDATLMELFGHTRPPLRFKGE